MSQLTIITTFSHGQYVVGQNGVKSLSETKGGKDLLSWPINFCIAYEDGHELFINPNSVENYVYGGK